MIIFSGPQLVQIDDDAYIPVLEAERPTALGKRAANCFPELWDVLGPMLKGVLETGEATWSEDLVLMLERSGIVEACYFTLAYRPAGPAPSSSVPPGTLASGARWRPPSSRCWPSTGGPLPRRTATSSKSRRASPVTISMPP